MAADQQEGAKSRRQYQIGSSWLAKRPAKADESKSAPSISSVTAATKDFLFCFVSTIPMHISQ